MNEHAQCIVHCERSERIRPDHVVNRERSLPEQFGIFPSLRTIIFFHLNYVSIAIIPLLPIQTGEEVLQIEVVEDNNSWMATAYLPNRTVKKAIVTNVVEAHVSAIEIRPRYSPPLVAPHFGVVLQVGIVFVLVRPEYDMGPSVQGRKYPRCVSGDPTLGRRQRRKPVQYHDSSLATTSCQEILCRS
jgi:hypothetical protein